MTNMQQKMEALRKIKDAVPRIASNIWINADFGDIRTDAVLTAKERDIIYKLDFVKSISRNHSAGTWCISI